MTFVPSLPASSFACFHSELAFGGEEILGGAGGGIGAKFWCLILGWGF